MEAVEEEVEEEEVVVVVVVVVQTQGEQHLARTSASLQSLLSKLRFEMRQIARCQR